MKEWQTPDGLKAQGIMGPVEWEEAQFHFRLIRDGDTWWIQRWWKGDDESTAHRRPITNYEAACLRRDQARTWLNTRDCAAIPREALRLGATDKDLIAAILAVGDKK